jgi:Galactosyltransferase
VQENASCETGCASATLEFVQFVHRHFDAEWILKLDDDVYLSPSRLLVATSQWNSIGVHYVGCMNHGLPVGQKPKKLQQSKSLFAHEKESVGMNGNGGSGGVLSLVDPYNTMHAAPSVYALARNVVSRMLRPNSHLLRDISEEGV